ncbi:transcription factor 20 [Carcharodon carcharias]|uniref:transcription factor 20 n=1 Tax=Carcharodon carcharias TaxID=13397 RepID=UPI001B7E76CC|nr:transcription factor 20 [Carcharodon carcharias]XP_041033778.1 transcription factor 20 [Carcharodon carcharias]
MQSYREQSSYHGNQRLLHQEAQESSRLGNYSQHHQGQMFASYANRPGSEGCNQQPYQAFRREPSDYYYTRGKELPGPQAQRRLAGPLQSGFGTQQAGGYSVQYLSEGQWRAPHSAMPGYSQFEQDAYTGQFSPSSGQQQLRHQPFQVPPGTQALVQPPPSSAHHPQHAHQPSSALLAKYQHRAPQYNPQQFQPAASTSSSSSSSSSSYLSPQGYSQPPGQAFDGYHMSASAQCDGYMVNATAAQSYGTQTGYSYQPPLAKPCFEQAKPAQGQQHGPQALQYSNTAKVPLGNQQFAPYCSADIPAKSPMPFHQNFSPSSNPSPATPVAQSPSCSSTPSPLMVSSESLQCGPGTMGMRNRVLQLMPQPSPTPTGLMPSPGSQSGAYEGFGLEGGAEKRASDLGQSSLTALSSQVANIPNRVQHLLISDTLALHRRQARRSNKRPAPGGPAEHLGLEEQLKSPQAESLDGGCSSSSEDHAERVRQLSGQSGCSERAYKAHNPETVNATCSPVSSHGDGTGRPLSKEEMIVQMCQEGKGSTMATLAEQGLRRGEKLVGVIVSRETMVSRGEGMGIGGQGEEHSRQATFLTSAEKESGHGQQLNNSRNIMVPSTTQNGNGLGLHQGNVVLSDPLATRMDTSKSPSYLAYGLRDLPKNDGRYHYMQYPMAPYSQPEAEQFGLRDRKVVPGKAEKSHSLLQEALQANYHGRKFHSSYAPEHQYSGFMDNPLQPGYPVRQMIELARKDGHNNALVSPSGWGDARTPGPGFGMELSKADPEAQFEAGTSERKTVICDISPSRPFGRSSVPPVCGQAQDREFGWNVKGAKLCKAGQSVIQSGIFVGVETKVKGEMDQSLGQQRSTGHYDGRDPGTPSPHWKYDSLELARASAVVSSSLPMGPGSNFLHQTLNNRPSRGRRACRVAGRAGARRRPPSRADDKALLARASLIKQEDAPEPRETGFLGQPRESLPVQVCNASLYPLPANSDVLSSLLTKPDDAQAAGMEVQAAARPPNHPQRQGPDPDPNVASDWTSPPEGKGSAAECRRSGAQKEAPAAGAVLQEAGGQAPPPSHEGRLEEWPAATEEERPPPRPGKKPSDLAQEDLSILSPILSRRRIRSFISPIPAKRLCQEPKARDAEGKLAPPRSHGTPQCNASLSPLPKAEVAEEPLPNADGKESPGASVSPAVSLASPSKLKTLPPRKGRGLKLEAIVQKIASPNGRKFPVSGALDGTSDGVTLEDILSVKEGCWESGDVPAVQLGDKGRGGSTEEPEAQAGDTGGANCPQGRGGSSSAVQILYHPEFKRRGSPCPLPRSPGHEVGQEPVGIAPKLEGGSVKGYFPSGKKRGRPLGSINKQKRQRPEGQGGQSRAEGPEEAAQKKRRPRRKRAPSHQRRRRKKLEGPLVLTQEPEIKLKHTARAAGRRREEAQDKTFSPYVLLERKREAALLCTIINTQDDERNRAQKGVKGHQGPASAPLPSCAGKALPTTSHMVLGPLVTECSTLGLLVCCLCGKCANHRDLGDLFGPYYPHQYAGTLPKNPPPKKMLPAQSRVKVRHKSMPELLKTGQSEDEGKEFGNLLGHPRFKRRHYSEDCTPSWASPRSGKGHRRCYCCEKISPSVNLRTQRLKSELSSQVDLQLPQLPLDPNELWIHESCVLWASGVYLVSGRLYGLQEAVEVAREMKCSHCQEPGATLGCYCKGCPLNYHYICAMEADCFLNEENFSMKCPKHKHRAAKSNSTEQSERG